MNNAYFSKLEPSDINFTVYSAIKYNAKIRNNRIYNRRKSSLLLIIKGEYLYSYGNGSFVATDNSLVVIPKGSTYSYKILSTKTECMQIELDMFYQQSLLTTENHPFVVDLTFGTPLANLFEKIIDLYTYKPIGYTFSATSVLFKIFAALVQNELKSTSNLQSKITPAVLFISQHYCEKIKTSTLAKLCLISESQLRRLFNSEYGVSPLQYKISLQIETACNLLESGNCQISQIAEMLGFDSIYEFSATFKRKMGKSPRKYVSDLPI